MLKPEDFEMIVPFSSSCELMSVHLCKKVSAFVHIYNFLYQQIPRKDNDKFYPEFWYSRNRFFFISEVDWSKSMCQNWCCQNLFCGQGETNFCFNMIWITVISFFVFYFYAFTGILISFAQVFTGFLLQDLFRRLMRPYSIFSIS